jgi:hypothetical protein
VIKSGKRDIVEFSMNIQFIKETAERAGRTFLQAYLAFWLVVGSDFDSLFTLDNLKAGVVAVALSVAMSLGLKNVGPNKDSAGSI